MTDLSKTSGRINVEVNVTGAGQINGFDVVMNYYNLTIGSIVLNATGNQADLSGSMFENAGCQRLNVKNEVDVPDGRIRVAQALLGCSVEGTGTLFKVTFDVVGVGVAAIDIVPTNTGGSTATYIAFAGTNVPYDSFSAYFRNKQGIPPVADFTYLPAEPKKGGVVEFNGTASFDPNNSTGTNRGIKLWIWRFGDGTGALEGKTASHIFLNPPVSPAEGNYTVTLIVRDYGDGLASRKSAVVDVEPGILHNITVSLTINVIQIAEGGTLLLSLSVTNNGNQNESVTVTVNYDYNGSTPIGRESNLNLTTISSGTRVFSKNYSLDTTGLVPRIYTVTAEGKMYNSTGIVPDDIPSDNTSRVTFNLVAREGSGSISLLIVIGIIAAVIVVALLVVRQLRRRKEET